MPAVWDFFNQRPRDLPERYRRAQAVLPQPRGHPGALTAEEEAELAAWSRSALRRARSVYVVCPTGGFSLADVPGGALWDPEADAAFIDALREALPPEIPFEEVDAHVDDPEFADLVAERYLTLAKETADVV